MCNFVSQPTLEAMKTLLIIGNVLSYNMNPGVSYVLLGMAFSQFLHSSNTNFSQGMTIRMSIALGLHAESNRFDFTERYTRRHIWLVFHFALITIWPSN